MDRLIAYAHPLSVLVVTNLLGMAASLLGMLRTRDRDDRSFGRLALLTIVLLDLFAYLTGFSIGGLIALITLPTGAILALLAKHYRAPIAAATSINLLMFLASAGRFEPAASLYQWMPLLIMGVSAAGAVRHWGHTQKVLGNSLAILAGLGFLALLTDSALSGWIALAPMALGWSLGVIFKPYRWEFLLLGWGSFLWALNVLLQACLIATAAGSRSIFLQ